MKFFIILFVISATFSLKIQQNELSKVKNIKDVRIIGGEIADSTEFPYMAAIWTTTSLGRYFCGGAIIDRQWILTAGHCVHDAISFSIQVGSINLTGYDTNRVLITEASSFIHPQFDAEAIVNNIGLIKIKDSLKYNDYVNVIKLPTEPLEADVQLVSIGWGQIDDEHSGPVNTLRKVTVISLLNEHCSNYYGNQVKDNNVCAIGGYNEGTCIGDTGGPLIKIENGEAVHVGIASFLSFNGCETTEPSGYERTYNYLNWIKNVTSNF